MFCSVPENARYRRTHVYAVPNVGQPQCSSAGSCPDFRTRASSSAEGFPSFGRGQVAVQSPFRTFGKLAVAVQCPFRTSDGTLQPYLPHSESSDHSMQPCTACPKARIARRSSTAFISRKYSGGHLRVRNIYPTQNLLTKTPAFSGFRCMSK